MSKRTAIRKRSTPNRTLVKNTHDDSLDLLIEQIRSASSADRDSAAIRLRAFGQDVVDALWRSIRKRANVNRRGTMVRTLQVFDCADRFDDLLKLALHGNFEVQCHALKILQKQSFSITPQQLQSARKQVKALRSRKNLTAEDVSSLRPLLEAVLQRLHRALASK